jgi:DNA-binding MurR/RpiR family transcriptional regulator
MGVTISSKRHSCDMGYHGFDRFRNAVAEKVNDKFYKHYLKLSDSETMFLMGKARKDFFEEYDTTTKEYIKQNVVTIEIANFLYQSDCNGKIDRKQAKQIYELIKECDDSISFGYSGRSDCAKMSDLKKIFSDRTKVEWS